METSKDLNADHPSVSALLDLIAALRGENGCPWDRDQTPDSISVYLIEETYELVDAIMADADVDVQEELGDVLFQILFLISIYQQQGRLNLSAVLKQNMEKMIRRHPHVFGEVKLATSDDVKEQWREIKFQEKNGQGVVPKSLLDSVPVGMPGLMRAFRISERAAGVGFEWKHLRDVIDQVESEWVEFKAELQLDAEQPSFDMERAAMEFGDVLFSMVNVARIAGIHPETALSRSTQKFVDRFMEMESMAAKNSKQLEDLSYEAFQQYWQIAKQRADTSKKTS